MLYVAFMSAVILTLLYVAEVLAFYGLVSQTDNLKIEPSNEVVWASFFALVVTSGVLFVYWIASTLGIHARKTDLKSFVSYGLIAFVLAAVFFLATGSSPWFVLVCLVFSVPAMLLHYRISKNVFSDYFSETSTQKKSTGNRLNKTWEKKENA